MTKLNFTECHYEGRNAFDSGSRYSFECVTSRGGVYRGYVYLTDEGGAVASAFKLKTFAAVTRMSQFGSKLHTAAIAHVKNQQSKISI
jgi:hypothetical protein